MASAKASPASYRAQNIHVKELKRKILSHKELACVPSSNYILKLTQTNIIYHSTRSLSMQKWREPRREDSVSGTRGAVIKRL